MKLKILPIFAFILFSICACVNESGKTTNVKSTTKHNFDFLNASAELPASYKEISLDNLMAKIAKSDKEADKTIAQQLERFKKSPFETVYFENEKSNFDYIYIQTGLDTKINQNIFESYSQMINRSLKMGWMGKENTVEQLENKFTKGNPSVIDLVHKFTILGEEKYQSHHVVNSASNSFSITSVSDKKLDLATIVQSVKFNN